MDGNAIEASNASAAARTILFRSMPPPIFFSPGRKTGPLECEAALALETGQKRPVNIIGDLLRQRIAEDRKSTRLNSSHVAISYAVFCLKKKKNNTLNKTIKPP